MPQVFLSPFAGAGAQFFDNNGVILSGGKIYTYAAGTTTPQTTYTSSSGATAHANPIVLDSAGRVPGGEIWLTDTLVYKFVVETSTAVLLGTYDNISGINAIQINADIVVYDPPFTGGVSTNVEAKLAQYISVKDFGAVGNGTTNDAAAFVAAAATGKKVLVPAGDYLIGTSISLGVQMEFVQGAKILVGNGITVTFNGTLSAGVYRIFQCTGTGEIVLNWRYTNEAYPEWWGAASDGATDCLAGIQACLKAAQTTKLHPGDYFVSGTVKILYDHRWLIGSGSQYAGVNDKVTRLLVTNGSNYTLQVGPDAQPATINDFQKQNVVRDIQIGRTAAPVIASDCAGINAQYTLYCELKSVKAEEHIAGFRFYANVYLKCNDCFSVRASAGTGGGTDKWYGYYVDGAASFGASGGNASLYINYCTASCNRSALSSGQSYGFFANQKFTDLFIESPETVNCNIGMYIEGDAPTTNVYSNLDLQIKNPIHDAFFNVGTYFKNINKYGSASLIGGYHGAHPNATRCIWVEDCEGSVAIIGGQVIVTPSATATGVVVENSHGTVIDRTQILEPRAYGVLLNKGYNCDIRPVVKNYSNTLTQAAVTLIDSSRNYVAPIAYGDPSLMAYGINVGDAISQYNELNCTTIESSVVGGSADKLVINGVQITVTGLSGTNLVSGVMA
jgi:hypothetical protein